MKKRRPVGKRRWRRRYSLLEQHTLLQTRLLDFASNEILDRIELQFGPEQTSYRKRIETQRQLGCFIDWIGAQDFWYERAWKECLDVRYHNSHARTLRDFIPADWRAKLERRATQLATKPHTPRFFIRQVVEVIPELQSNSVLVEFLAGFLRAHSSRERTAIATFDAALTDARVLERLFSKYAYRDSPQKHESRQGRFLELLTCSPGSPGGRLGEVTYLLSSFDHLGLGVTFQETKTWLIEFWCQAMGLNDLESGHKWEPWLRLNRMTDYLSIDGLREPLKSVVKKHRIDPAVASRIVRVYFELSVKENFGPRLDDEQQVFLAAKLLDTRYEKEYDTYLEKIREFRRNSLTPFIAASDVEERRRIGLELIVPFHNCLLEDPLLNCVFHSEVFAGHKRLVRPLSKGRPAETVEGFTGAFAVHMLREKNRIDQNLKATAALLTELFGPYTQKRAIDAYDRYSIRDGFKELIEKYGDVHSS